MTMFTNNHSDMEKDTVDMYVEKNITLKIIQNMHMSSAEYHVYHLIIL